MKRLLVLLVALVATGCSAPAEHAVDQEPAPQKTSSRATLEPIPRAAPVVPEDLHLWKFDAPVVPLHLQGNALVPPSDPSTLGWWGRRAGAAQGTTLLTGHTVHTGGGELDDLELTPVGSVATVSGFRYRVVSVSIISKAALARRAPALFSQNGNPRLVLVTCEGYNWSTGHYADNVVVVGKPISGPRDNGSVRGTGHE